MPKPNLFKSYAVPLVGRDVQESELIKDMMSQLHQLDQVVDTVFSNITTRIASEKSRLAHLNQRCHACRQLIASVQGSTKATTVFSTAKYLAPTKLPYPYSLHPTGLLTTQDLPTLQSSTASDDEVIYEPADPEASVLSDEKLFAEVLELFTRLNIAGTDLERAEVVMEDAGLGSLPLGISSISSLLLFNSSINPYKNYSTLDNLLDAFDRKSGKEEAVIEDKKTLALAPTTMRQGDVQLLGAAGIDYTYKPQLGNMPTLDLPEGLDLPDVARNVNFQGTDLAAAAELLRSAPIAPSYFLSAQASVSGGDSSAAATAAVLAYLPPVDIIRPPPPPSSSSQPTIPGMSLPPPPPPPPLPPPPPPSISFQQPLPMMQAPIPPHPPPPLPPAIVRLQANGAVLAPEQQPLLPPPPPRSIPTTTTAPPKGLALPTATPNRTSLLDAIRGMDVSKLKSMKEQNVQEERAATKKAAKENEPLSMMDEMRMKLGRRQAAISGKSDKRAAASPSGASGGGGQAASFLPISKGRRLHDDDDASSSDSGANGLLDEHFSASPTKPTRALPPIPSVSPPSQHPRPPSLPSLPSTPSMPRGSPVERLNNSGSSSLFDTSNSTLQKLISAGRTTRDEGQKDQEEEDDDDDWDSDS